MPGSATATQKAQRRQDDGQSLPWAIRMEKSHLEEELLELEPLDPPRACVK